MTNGGISNWSYAFSTFVLLLILVFILPLPVYILNVTGKAKTMGTIGSEHWDAKFGTLTEETKMDNPL